MVATIFLWMGINILNIERIVNWKFPIKFNIYDMWQRISRGDRGLDRTSQRYLLLLY